MKRFLSIITLFIGLGLFTACHDSNDDRQPPRVAEKTLLIFMPWAGDSSHGSNNLYNDFTENIKDIETAIARQGGLNGKRLLVYISQSPTQSALVEISFQRQQCVRDTVKRYTRFDHTTPGGIATILSDVKRQAEASTYAMVVGCHGKGWIPKGIEDYYKTRSFGGTEEAYQIETYDLADGIALAGMHMQFIAFDDCYMAGIEVAYDLKDAADYLIASTSEIMAAGLPYRQILPYLIALQPNYEAIVDSFHHFYSQYDYPYGTLATIDCSQVDETARLMRDINSRYTFDSNHTDRLQKLDGAAQTIFFDMRDYTTLLCKGSEDADLLSQQIARLVPYAAATDYIYTAFVRYNGGFDKVKVDTFSGITISDPTTNKYVVNQKSQTGWWKATHSF